MVTGTRAEYGLLYWVMKTILADPDLELNLVVTGMHLSPEFGLTFKTIEEDGFKIDEKVEILLSSDTEVGVSKAVGLATISFAEIFARTKPDFVMVLGDRFELLAAAQAALFSKIPLIHLAGGDVTEGAFDEAIRHSITKMAHLHFVTNPGSAKRVRQLGEDPSKIFNVGNPGLEHLRHLKLMSKEELSDSLNFKLRPKNLLITFHPVTLEKEASSNQFSELLAALNKLDEQYGIIFTKPNADNEGRELINQIDNFVKHNKNSLARTSLGQLRYLSAVKHVDAVVGNSSSGLLEVPSLKTPTINIGDRQKGRLKASSVIDCKPDTKSILEAIRISEKLDCSDAINPYGDGYTADKVVSSIKSIKDPLRLIKKKFNDVDFYFESS